jgi:hypothetical protein
MKRTMIFFMILMLMTISVFATPLSIIDSKYVEYSDETNSNAFKVIMRGDSSSDYIMFAEGSQLTGTENGVPIVAQENFKLESSIVKETCSYNLYADHNQPDFYSYKIDEHTGIWPWQLSDKARNLCSGSKLIWARGFGTYTLYCLYQNNEGLSGDVSEGKMDFQAKFTLTGPNDYKKIETVNSLGMQSEKDVPSSVTFTDNGKTVASVRWIGGTIYGEWCPGQDSLSAVQAKDNTWYTARKLDYINYQNYYNQLEDKIDYLMDILIDSGKVFYQPWPATQDQELKDLMDKTETWRQKAMQKEVLIKDNKVATFAGSKTILELGRDHLLFAPDFEITVNADWLKLMYLVGKPEIIDISHSTCIEGSELNQVEVTVRNIGSAKGTFMADITCDTGISISTTQRSIPLDENEIGTLNIPFNVAIDKDQAKSCKVTITDNNRQENKDSKNINMDCVATKFCQPEGITRCVGSVHQMCKDGNWITTESEECMPDDKCNKNGVCEPWLGESFEKCGGKTTSLNDCATCNKDGVCDPTETIYSCNSDCGNVPPPKDYSIYFWIAGGIIAAVGLSLLFKKKPNKRRKKK